MLTQSCPMTSYRYTFEVQPPNPSTQVGISTTRLATMILRSLPGIVIYFWTLLYPQQQSPRHSETHPLYGFDRTGVESFNNQILDAIQSRDPVGTTLSPYIHVAMPIHALHALKPRQKQMLVSRACTGTSVFVYPLISDFIFSRTAYTLRTMPQQ